MSKRLYFDHASATPVDSSVIEAMVPFWREKFDNPSALYEGGRQAKEILNRSRQSIAAIIGAKPGEVIFTSGGTEANNLAIKGVMGLYSGANVITSAIEHDSVLKPSAHFHHKIAPVDKNGAVDLQKLNELIDNKTALVSIQYANNEIGAIQNLKNISGLIQKVRKHRLKTGIKQKIYFHSDACQAVNYLGIVPSSLGLDLMSVNGGKIYGPKGSGFLYVKSGVMLRPQIEGGGQEYGLRSGTENLAVEVGLSKALEKANKLRRNESDRLMLLSDNFLKEIYKKIPGTTFNGPIKNRLPNIINLSFQGIDNERLIYMLDMAGLACSAGSACSASGNEPSHVLSAIGLNKQHIRSSLRFSMGRLTTQRDIKKAVEILADCIDKEQ